jgi:hypothetical protein
LERARLLQDLAGSGRKPGTPDVATAPHERTGTKMRTIEANVARALAVAAACALLACGGRTVTGDLAHGRSDALLASFTFHSGAPKPPLVRGLFSIADFGTSFVAVSDAGLVYSLDDLWEWPVARQLDAEEIGTLRQLLAAAEAVNFEDRYTVADASVSNATALRLGERAIHVTGDPGCSDPTAWQGIVPSEVCALAQHLLELRRGGTPVEPSKVKLQGLALPDHLLPVQPARPWPLSTIDLADVVGEEPLVVEEASQVQQLIALFKRSGENDRYTAPVFAQDWMHVAIDVWPVIEAVNP